MGTRQQREHQRPTPTILPEGHRSVGLPARLPRPRRRQTQHPTPRNTQLADPRRSPRQATVEPRTTTRCCTNRLNPPARTGPIRAAPEGYRLGAFRVSPRRDPALVRQPDYVLANLRCRTSVNPLPVASRGATVSRANAEGEWAD